MESVDVTETTSQPRCDVGAVVFHIHGHVFNLTRQVLMDSVNDNKQYTFFFDILTMYPDDFNTKYDRHAYFQNVKYGTAHILLNVNLPAFSRLIEYLITGTEEYKNTYCNYFNQNSPNIKEQMARFEMERSLVNNLIDLGSIFGMDKFTTMNRENLTVLTTLLGD